MEKGELSSADQQRLINGASETTGGTLVCLGWIVVYHDKAKCSVAQRLTGDAPFPPRRGNCCGAGNMVTRCGLSHPVVDEWTTRQWPV